MVSFVLYYALQYTLISVSSLSLYKSSFGCSHGNECQKSWVGWSIRMVGPIHSIFGLLILLS